MAQCHLEASLVSATRKQDSSQTKAVAIELEIRGQVQGTFRIWNPEGLEASWMWEEKEKLEVTAVFLAGHS